MPIDIILNTVLGFFSMIVQSLVANAGTGLRSGAWRTGELSNTMQVSSSGIPKTELATIQDAAASGTLELNHKSYPAGELTIEELGLVTGREGRVHVDIKSNGNVVQSTQRGDRFDLTIKE